MCVELADATCLKSRPQSAIERFRKRDVQAVTARRRTAVTCRSGLSGRSERRSGTSRSSAASARRRPPVGQTSRGRCLAHRVAIVPSGEQGDQGRRWSKTADRSVHSVDSPNLAASSRVTLCIRRLPTIVCARSIARQRSRTRSRDFRNAHARELRSGNRTANVEPQNSRASEPQSTQSRHVAQQVFEILCGDRLRGTCGM